MQQEDGSLESTFWTRRDKRLSSLESTPPEQRIPNVYRLCIGAGLVGSCRDRGMGIRV